MTTVNKDEDGTYSVLSGDTVILDKMNRIGAERLAKELNGTTPDTEWEVRFDKQYTSQLDFGQIWKFGMEVTPSMIKAFLKQELFSHDTYWKEQLQKAREEEREMNGERAFTLKQIQKAMQSVFRKYPTNDSYELNVQENLSKLIRHELNDNSKLDQGNECNRIGGHLGDDCCCHTKSCDLDIYPIDLSKDITN